MKFKRNFKNINIFKKIKKKHKITKNEMKKTVLFRSETWRQQRNEVYII